MTSYYDYVLGLIPVALLGITLSLSLLGLPLTTAVPIGGGVSALLVGHALFVNGPVAEPEAPDAAARTGPAPNAD